MSKQFHFISGLPRSGSTLLAAILRQNPRFHAGMSSGLGALVAANMQIMSAGSEVSMMMDETQRPRILRALFDAYYTELPQDQLVFDTNRAWCGRMPLLADLFPDSRVIACVRDLPWIFDSLERLLRKNPYENTRLFGADAHSGGVSSRADTLARPDRLVGGAYNALKDAFYGEQADSLLVVEYELLARAPEQVLRLIYEFIGEPWYDGHDFDNVEFDAPAFDAALGVDGLHRVQPRVEFKPRRTILPPDVFRKFKDMDFWRETAGTRAHVVAAQKQASDEIEEENDG